jgi:hypothetical protein
MRITLDTTPNAPGCYRIEAEDGQDILIQTDWDFPGLATMFGWCIMDLQAVIGENDEGEPLHGLKCLHPNTDGTIDCACGLKTTDFISAAQEYLDDNDGKTIDDPGYFEEDESFRRNLTA